MGRRGPAVLAVWLLLSALAACGRVGPPAPPERVAPDAATDLTGVVVERGIEERWALPTRRADRKPLRDLAVLHVFRTDDDGTGDPKPALRAGEHVAGYAEVAAIRLVDPAPAVQVGNQVTFVDPAASTPGRRYSYVILAEDARRHVSAPSARLSIVRITPPAAPAALRATPGDREVRLEWKASPQLADGTATDERFVYQILRAPGPDAPLETIDGHGPSRFDVVTQTAPGATGFVDKSVDNERPYVYAVRALRVARGTVARSDSSERVTAIAVTSTPPAPPTDLVAVPSTGAVRLVWIASVNRDVGRYIVYRGRDDGPLERIGSTPAPGTTFTDRDVPAGRWRYAVSAQDTSSRANESPRSSEVSVDVP